MNSSWKIVPLAWFAISPGLVTAETGGKDLGAQGLQLAANPPMMVITNDPPPPAPVTEKFEIRAGYRVITTLDEFRQAIKKDNQKIRMKPGIYRATSVDPPVRMPIKKNL